MPSKTHKIYLQTTGILFVVGVLLGLLCAGVQYAGAFLLIMGFAMAPAIVYGFDLRGKLVCVLAMDVGLIIGATIRTAYWRSLHGFESLVEWEITFFLAVLAILVSGFVGAILFLMERIWPTRTDTPSEQSENSRTDQ